MESIHYQSSILIKQWSSTLRKPEQHWGCWFNTQIPELTPHRHKIIPPEMRPGNLRLCSSSGYREERDVPPEVGRQGGKNVHDWVTKIYTQPSCVPAYSLGNTEKALNPC